MNQKCVQNIHSCISSYKLLILFFVQKSSGGVAVSSSNGSLPSDTQASSVEEDPTSESIIVDHGTISHTNDEESVQVSKYVFL